MLGYKGSSVPALVVALKDDDVKVRQAASKSLGRIAPDPAALPALRQALSDEDLQVCYTAILATTKFRKPGSTWIVTNLSVPVAQRFQERG